MLLDVLEDFLKFVFGYGVIACLGRLGLMALYVVGASSIYWGKPLGPLLALNFAGILLYRLGHCRLLGLLLQPDLVVWEKSEGIIWASIGAGLVLSLGLYGPFVMALMYNTPLHGAWMIPLPTLIMALQKLADRRKQRRSPPVDPPAPSIPHTSFTTSLLSDPIVGVQSATVAAGTSDAGGC